MPATRPHTSYVINTKFEHRNIEQPLNDPTRGNATQTHINEQKLTMLPTALFGWRGSIAIEAILDTARTLSLQSSRADEISSLKRSTRYRAEYTVTSRCTVPLELDPGQFLSEHSALHCQQTFVRSMPLQWRSLGGWRVCSVLSHGNIYVS